MVQETCIVPKNDLAGRFIKSLSEKFPPIVSHGIRVIFGAGPWDCKLYNACREGSRLNLGDFQLPGFVVRATVLSFCFKWRVLGPCTHIVFARPTITLLSDGRWVASGRPWPRAADSATRFVSRAGPRPGNLLY